MLRNPSLLIQQTSGFVPFSGGGTVDPASLDDTALRSPADSSESTTTELDGADLRGMRQMTWAPAGAVHVRGVEMAVVAAICGYFAFGLGKVLGLL